MKKNYNIENWELMAKYFADECTSQEQEELFNWKNESKENQLLYNQVKEDIELINLNKSMNKVNVESAWEKVENRIQEDELKLPEVEEKKTRFVFSPVLKYAAVALLLLSIGFFTTKIYQNVTTQNVNYAYASKSEQGKEIILPDGSEVVLNADSKIAYPKEFAANERKVTLHGEAFFDVTKNTEKPFIIEAEEAEVRVLGTSFNVNADIPGDKVEVFVETGLVQLSRKKNGEEKVLINPGDVGVLNSNLLIKEKNKDQNIIAWKTKELVFRDDKLDNVIQTLNKVYNVSIECTNQEVLNLKYTSTFRNQDIDNVLSVICLTFNLKTEIKNNTIYLVKYNS